MIMKNKINKLFYYKNDYKLDFIMHLNKTYIYIDI